MRVFALAAFGLVALAGAASAQYYDAELDAIVIDADESGKSSI